MRAAHYIVLGFALLIALGVDFVNGFHDTANAVATVIYTHSLTPNIRRRPCSPNTRPARPHPPTLARMLKRTCEPVR